MITGESVSVNTSLGHDPGLLRGYFNTRVCVSFIVNLHLSPTMSLIRNFSSSMSWFVQASWVTCVKDPTQSGIDTALAVFSEQHLKLFVHSMPQVSGWESRLLVQGRLVFGWLISIPAASASLASGFFLYAYEHSPAACLCRQVPLYTRRLMHTL